MTREVLAGVEADAGVMTTGSSGYHVVVRLDSGSGFDEVGRAARGIAELVAATRPERFTTAFRKRDRLDESVRRLRRMDVP